MHQSEDNVEPHPSTWDVMRPREENARWSYNFISNKFDKVEIDFGKEIGVYRVEKKLREGNDAEEEHEGSNEARSVYLADSTLDKSKRAILKIRLQICPAPPVGETASIDPQVNKKYAAPKEKASQNTFHELEALTTFRHAKAKHLPHLLACKWDIQSEGMPVPGGYICYILMTCCPGIALTRPILRGMELEEQRRVLHAFTAALVELGELGIIQDDKKSENVLWDADSGVCFLVDFEVWQSVDPIRNVVVDAQTLKNWQFPTKFINAVIPRD